MAFSLYNFRLENPEYDDWGTEDLIEELYRDNPGLAKSGVDISSFAKNIGAEKDREIQVERKRERELAQIREANKDTNVIVRGAKSGLYDLAATVPIVGSMALKAVGADETGEKAFGVGKRLLDRSAAYQKEEDTTFEELVDDPSLGGALNWAGYTLGKFGPQMLTAATGAGLAARGAAGFAARLALQKGLTKEAKKRAVKEFVKSAASAKARKRGMRAGVIGAMGPMEASGMFAEDVEGRGFDEANPFTAAAGGLVAGAIETAGGHMRLIKGVFGKAGVKAITKNPRLLTRMTKAAARIGVEEAGQELAQEEVAIINKAITDDKVDYLDTFGDREFNLRRAESLAGGGLAGVTLGGFGGIRKAPVKPDPGKAVIDSGFDRGTITDQAEQLEAEAATIVPEKVTSRQATVEDIEKLRKKKEKQDVTQAKREVVRRERVGEEAGRAVPDEGRGVGQIEAGRILEKPAEGVTEPVEGGVRTDIAIERRVREKYKDILSLPESEAPHWLFNAIEEKAITPKRLDKFLNNAKDKKQALIDIKSSIADQTGDLLEVHKYESAKDGLALEKYYDSLLEVTRKYSLPEVPAETVRTPPKIRPETPEGLPRDRGLIPTSELTKGKPTLKQEKPLKVPLSVPGKAKPTAKEALEAQVEIKGKKAKTVSVALTKKEEAALVPKEQKAYLLAEIDKAIEKEGKALMDESKSAKEIIGMAGKGFNPLGGSKARITFKVPADGEYTIAGSELLDFKKRAAGFPTKALQKPSKPYGGPFVSPKRRETNFKSYLKAQKIEKPEDIKPKDIEKLFKGVQEIATETKWNDITRKHEVVARYPERADFANWLLSHKLKPGTLLKIKEVVTKTTKPQYKIEFQDFTDSTKKTVFSELIESHPILKKAKIKETVPGNAYEITLPTGKKFSIYRTDKIHVPAELRAKHKGKDLTDKLIGVYFKQAGQDQIWLTRKAGRYTITHELEHFFEANNLINTVDVAVLNKAILKQGKKPSSEARAEYIERAFLTRDVQNFGIKKILKKIADFLDAVVNVFGIRTARGIVKDIESGKIMGRQAVTQKGGLAPQYKVEDIGEEIQEPRKQSLIDKILPKKAEQDPAFANIKDWWLGKKHVELYRNAVQARRLQKRIIKALGKKRYDRAAKDIDSAIHIYLDLKRNPEHYDMYYQDLTEEDKMIADIAKKIDTMPEIKAIADDISAEYEKIGQKAYGQGLIHNMLDNYVSRAWKALKKEDRFAAEAMRKFGVKTRHRKHRVFETILEGMALKNKAGEHLFQLQVHGATTNLQTYKDEIARTMEDAAMQKVALETEWKDTGEMMLTDKSHLAGYVKLEHPNMTKVHRFLTTKGGFTRDSYTDEEGKVHKLGRNAWIEKTYALVSPGRKNAHKAGFESPEEAQAWLKNKIVEVQRTIEGTVPKAEKRLAALHARLLSLKKAKTQERGIGWERVPLYAPAEVAKSLNRILGQSRLKGLKGIDTATKYNALIKAWILQTSFFHHLAFMRSYILGTTGKTLKEWNINQARKEGLQAIEDLNPTITLLVRNGLTLFKVQDWEESILRNEDTIFGKIMDKTKASKAVKDKVNELRERQADFLFGNFGAGLKAQAALIEYRNALKRHPEMGEAERAKMVSNLINDDFGGLNLERMERDPTRQHIFRLLALAPDWTESNVRTMVKMVGRGGKEERALYRRFWASVLTKGITATILANMLMAVGDDEDNIERFRKAWKAGNFKWLGVDITPIYKLMGGKTEARKYFSLFGHFQDPMKFITHPVRSAHHKGSVLYRTFHEAMAGTDWRGHGFTTLPEMLGVDDKGLYLTGRRRGQPKGGKLGGKVTAFGGKTGPIAPRQYLSYALTQMRGMQPVQVQNLLGWMQGEIEGFDAIGRSLGLHTKSTYPSKRRTIDEFVDEFIVGFGKSGLMLKLRIKIRDYNKRQREAGRLDDIISFSTISRKARSKLQAERLSRRFKRAA